MGCCGCTGYQNMTKGCSWSATGTRANCGLVARFVGGALGGVLVSINSSCCNHEPLLWFFSTLGFSSRLLVIWYLKENYLLHVHVFFLFVFLCIDKVSIILTYQSSFLYFWMHWMHPIKRTNFLCSLEKLRERSLTVRFRDWKSAKNYSDLKLHYSQM